MTAGATPEVAVIIASYNHGPYIGEAVNSVLGQTVEALELVVVDDGSTDDSLAQLRAIERRDPRLRVLTHDGGANRGRQRSFRLAVERSSAPYIGILGSDDRWYPHKLECQLPAMRAGAVLSYGRTALIHQDGRKERDTYGSAISGVPAETLLRRNVIPVLTAIFRRDAYEEVGGFSVDRLWEDLDLHLRLTARAAPVFIDDVLTEYRVVASSVFHSTRAAARDFAATLDVAEQFAAWPALPAELRPLAESWCRCHRALVGLLDDQRDALSLRPDDGGRLALLVGDHYGRLHDTVGQARLEQLEAELARLGATFAPAVGVLRERRRRRLRRAVKLAVRRRDPRGVARSVTGLALDEVRALKRVAR